MKKRSVLLSLIAVCIALTAVFGGCSSSEDWVRKTIEKNYYRFDGDYSSVENMKGLSIDEMVERLDIYSDYYTEEEYEAVYADNGGNKSGVGVSYSFVQGKGVTLQAVIGNSPAKKAGLKAGDVILSAKTESGEEVTFSDGESFAAFADGCAQGEDFTLNLADGRAVTLAKASYTASYACMYTHDNAYEIEYAGGGMSVEKSDGGIAALSEDTAYVYLYQFYGNAYAEMCRLFEIFNDEGCTSLILDLRGNGGGYVDLMSQIGGLFTSRSGGAHQSMVAKYKNGGVQVAYCEEFPRGSYGYEHYALPEGTKVYLMANHNTASASEALTGILVSYDILKYEDIFLSKYDDSPAKSYGKGIMQSVFTNWTTGERLKLTVAGIYWPNGKTIHGVGLTENDGCRAAPSSDTIVNVGYDDELNCVLEKIAADRGQEAP